MTRDLFQTAEKSDSTVTRAPADLSSAVAVNVIYRSQVGACIPFTVLPKHYLGKKVRIVIVGEADE